MHGTWKLGEPIKIAHSSPGKLSVPCISSACLIVRSNLSDHLFIYLSVLLASDCEFAQVRVICSVLRAHISLADLLFGFG